MPEPLKQPSALAPPCLAARCAAALPPGGNPLPSPGGIRLIGKPHNGTLDRFGPCFLVSREYHSTGDHNTMRTLLKLSPILCFGVFAVYTIARVYIHLTALIG